MTLPQTLSESERFRQIRGVLLRVLFANALVSGGKLLVGLLTGTLAMVADGFHSAMDASSNLIGIAAASIAARPPDDEHPYGHRRFETLATLAIGGLLLVAAWEILSSALERLFSGTQVNVSPLNFGVMLVTMVINLVVVVYETAQGRRLHSDVLLADASQTRVDLFISASVILGLICTALGISWADTAIALMIVALIGRAAFVILSKTAGILADKRALAPETIAQVVQSVPGVERVSRVRSRGPSDAVQADLEVEVQPAVTAERASAIASEIEGRLRTHLQGISEVQVQVKPHYDAPLDRATLVRAVADALGLSVHEVAEIKTSEGLLLEMHVEVAPTLSLAAAHDQVTAFERRVLQAMPDVESVITHIEPRHSLPHIILETGRASALREAALAIAKQLHAEAIWYDAAIRGMIGGYSLTLHCALPGDISVQMAHQIAEDVETAIRGEIPPIRRVTIHTEPRELLQ
ncbi:MAG: hypothetical protein OHK0023_10930 [Anaerolineae bacterium]